MEPIDAIVVTLILGGKINQNWVYSIENGDPDHVNGSLVVAQMKMKELIEKHDPGAKSLSQENWVEIYSNEGHEWTPMENGSNRVVLGFSSRNTP